MPKLKDVRKKNKSRLKPREISEENLSLKNSQIDRLTMIDIAKDRKFKGRNKRRGITMITIEIPLRIFFLSILSSLKI